MVQYASTVAVEPIEPTEQDQLNRLNPRNLLNPVTLSTTNVAYSSVRMEPTFMMLGEVAGVAAALAVESKNSVQTVDYSSLRRRLESGGLRLAR